MLDVVLEVGVDVVVGTDGSIVVLVVGLDVVLLVVVVGESVVVLDVVVVGGVHDAFDDTTPLKPILAV